MTMIKSILRISICYHKVFVMKHVHYRKVPLYCYVNIMPSKIMKISQKHLRKPDNRKFIISIIIKNDKNILRVSVHISFRHSTSLTGQKSLCLFHQIWLIVQFQIIRLLTYIIKLSLYAKFMTNYFSPTSSQWGTMLFLKG